VSPSGVWDFRRPVGLLFEPAQAAGLTAKDKLVYHLVVASAKAAGRGLEADWALSDGAWAQISTDQLDRTGLARRASVCGLMGVR